MSLQATQTILFFSTLLVSGSTFFILLKNKEKLFLENNFYSISFIAFILMGLILFGFWFVNIWAFIVMTGILLGAYASWLYLASKLRAKNRERQFSKLNN